MTTRSTKTKPATTMAVETAARMDMGASTRAVHSGSNRQKPYHALIEPIVQTATYTFDNSTDLREHMEMNRLGINTERIEYGRYGNPTVAAAERLVAALEGAESAIQFSSGMAALTSVLLSVLPANSHLVITDDCYRRSRQFCREFLPRFNISCSVVPMGDYQALENAIRPETRVLLSETPTNPYLRILDVERFAEIARRHNVLSIIDATFATPINLRPLEWGVDLVLHSATKYLSGHHDLLAGVVAGASSIVAPIREHLNLLGSVPDPNNAYRLLRGMRTLSLRVNRHNENGQNVAEFLASHPAVERVWYPGLTSHPEHKIAVQQMTGFGGVVSFEVKTDFDGTSRFVDALRIPYISASLGGLESLVSQPALLSYYNYTSEQRRELGIRDNLVRLALGVEDYQDLISDLDQALITIQG